MLLCRFHLRRCFIYSIGILCFLLVIVNFKQSALNNSDHNLTGGGGGIAGEKQKSQQQTLENKAGENLPLRLQYPSPTPSGQVVITNGENTKEENDGLLQEQQPLKQPLQQQLQSQEKLVIAVPTENGTEKRKHLQKFVKQTPAKQRRWKKGNKTLSKSFEKDYWPWFFSGGKRWPVPAKVSRKTRRRVARLWPQEDPGSDRVPNQLMFYPPDRGYEMPMKKILIFHGLNSWGLKPGQEAFKNCPVNQCTLTGNKAESLDANAILFKDHFVHPGHHRPHKQVWIIYFLECPYHTQHIKYNDVFNWTATYRRDSDIVAPYERWAYYNESQTEYPGPLRDFVGNKTDKVAWFVSNCGARNARLQYAHELSKYIQVDIYGACGKLKCPRSIADKCFEMLTTKYKYYLAFENSNCKDYITEKLFVNGLGHNVLPIVMGAPPEDYQKSAPKHSFIHVDDFPSPKELAAYLLKLDADNDLYNSYFKWKGTGEFINTYFFCRLCSMLHDDNSPIKSYRDINDWWRAPGTCTTGSWRKQQTKNRWSTLENKVNYESAP